MRRIAAIARDRFDWHIASEAYLALVRSLMSDALDGRGSVRGPDEPTVLA